MGGGFREIATVWSSRKTFNEPLEEMQARLKLAAQNQKSLRVYAAIHGSRTSFIEPSLKRRLKRPLTILGGIDLDV